MELVNYTEAVQGNLAADWMTYNTVVPLRKDWKCSVDDVNDCRGQEGKVLKVVFPSSVRKILYRIYP